MHGLKVWLVDARQLKYVPGRKSDAQGCRWLQRLMSLGLLRAAWRPSAEVLSDAMGQTGQAVIRDIAADQRDAGVPARHRQRRVKISGCKV